MLTLGEVEGFTKIFSHGKTDCGIVYIVMQKLGPSLKYMLRRTKRQRFSLKTGV